MSVNISLLEGVTTRLGWKRSLKRTTVLSEIFFAFVLVGILAMISLPLSPVLIDMLVTISLRFSWILVLVSIITPRELGFLFFPSAFLISTLYRLGLNIAATRQILLHANAGKTIFSFGEFVVGGNFVVGGVLFLIITLVQFFVITIVAKRVRKTVARFSAERMPGIREKMASELRDGGYDAKATRETCFALQKECHFYDAMGGAMKLVKGEAFVAFGITAVNMVAGISIGMALHDMEWSDAAGTYSILSFGIGLVSQIPVLLISFAGGIFTRRVTRKSISCLPS